MKRLFKWLWLGCLISIVSCNDTNTKPVAYTNHDSVIAGSPVVKTEQAMSLIIQEMMNQLLNQSYTGNIDYDFAKMIVLNQKAGVEMGELLLLKSKNEQLKKFASDAIEVQKNKIEDITKFHTSDSSHISPSSQKFQQEVNNALRQVVKNQVLTTNDLEKDYVLLMSQNNEMAMKMARAHLNYGSVQTLKIISRSILSGADEEIRWMGNWLNKRR